MSGLVEGLVEDVVDDEEEDAPLARPPKPVAQQAAADTGNADDDGGEAAPTLSLEEQLQRLMDKNDDLRAALHAERQQSADIAAKLHRMAAEQELLVGL